MIYVQYLFAADSGMDHDREYARFSDHELSEALYDAAYAASIDPRIDRATVYMVGRQYVFHRYGGNYNRVNVCGDIAETFEETVELIYLCRYSCDVRDADGELVCEIGKAQAKLVVGENREWLLGVSYHTAVVIWYKDDGRWYRTWLRHCNHSRTTVQHRARIINAAHDEVGNGIDRAQGCEFSVFVDATGGWRELGLYDRSYSDSEFIDAAFNEHGGGRLACRGW